MKHTRTTALAAVTLAAALSLTACGGGGSSDKASSDTSSSSSSDTSQDGGNDGKHRSNGDVGDTGAPKPGPDDGDQAPAGHRNGTGKGTGTGTGTGGTGSGKGSGGDGQQGRSCTVDDLSMSAREDSPDTVNGNVIVTMTNKGSATCSVTGFPAVSLTDADHTTSPLARDDNQPRIADLKPGQNGVFNISYKRSRGGEPGDSDPVELQVTPPHETRHVTLHWPAGAIKGMSNATALVHPLHANPMQ